MDETSYHLVVEVPSASSTESVSLDLSTMRATLFGTTRSRVAALFQTVANKLNLPTTMPLGLMMNDDFARVSSPGNTPLSDDNVKVVVNVDTHIILDGAETSFTAANEFVTRDTASLNSMSIHTTKQAQPFLSPQIHANNHNASKRPLSPQHENLHPNKRQKPTGVSDFPNVPNQIWTVHRGQWRLRVQPRSSSTSTDREEDEGRSVEIIMEAVKIEATTGEKARNAQKNFLE